MDEISRKKELKLLLANSNKMQQEREITESFKNRIGMKRIMKMQLRVMPVEKVRFLFQRVPTGTLLT